MENLLISDQSRMLHMEYRLPDFTVIDYRNFVDILQLQIRKQDGNRVEIEGFPESLTSRIMCIVGPG